MLFAFGVSKSEAQVTDKDGNTYKTITIGTQVWTAENLNVEHYRNGDVIPQVQNKENWKKLTTGAWCYYENNSENGKTYGKLYNWFAVSDPRGLAPEGWHIPSEAEWTKLTDFLGGKGVAGGKMKATKLWLSPNTGATNNSGFTGLPGGIRNDFGSFSGIGKYACFWSSSEKNHLHIHLYNESSYVYDSHTDEVRGLDYDYSDAQRGSYDILGGLSIRCVKD